MIHRSSPSISTIFSLLLAASSPLVAAGPATTQAATPRRGEILAITEQSITVVRFTPPADAERGDASQTYVLNDDTRVYIARLTEVRNEDRSVMRSYTTERVSRDELKVGMPVQITADGGTAMRITIWPDSSEPQ